MAGCRPEYDDISDDEKEIMKRNWRKNLSEIEKTAYREGAMSMEHKSDEMLQLGFDDGYKDGFKNGYKNSSYNSTVMMLNKFNLSENNEKN